MFAGTQRYDDDIYCRQIVDASLYFGYLFILYVLANRGDFHAVNKILLVYVVAFYT